MWYEKSQALAINIDSSTENWEQIGPTVQQLIALHQFVLKIWGLAKT